MIVLKIVYGVAIIYLCNYGFKQYVDRDIQGSRKNRRQLLKSIATGSGAVGIAMASTQGVAAKRSLEKGERATKHPNSKRLRERYGSPKKARELLINEADGLVNKFHEIGILPEENIDVYDFEKAANGTGEVYLSFVTIQKDKNSPEVGKVRLRRETTEYSVSVIVEPDSGHAYAIAVSEESENRLAVKGEGLVDARDDTSVDGDSVTSQDCECSSSPCSYSYPCAGSFCCDTEDRTYGKRLEWPTLICEPYRDSNGDCQCECDTYCSDSDYYNAEDCLCDSSICGNCNCW